MKSAILAGIAFILILVMVFHRSGTEVMVDGSLITIDSGSNHIEGFLEPEATFELLMKDEGVAINVFSGDAFFAALPLRTADKLRAQYGDFLKCDAPGAVQAMQSMQGIVLLAGSERAKEVLSEALSLCRASHIPVVRFTGSLIKVRMQTQMGIKVNDSTGTLLFYVNDFRILKPDYMK